MKIYDPGIYQLQGRSSAQQDQKKEDVAGPSFSEILEDASAPKGVGKPSSPSQIDSFGPSDVFSPAQKEALAKGEEILGLLSHLGEVMGSPEKSDSAVQSVADAISGKVDELRLLRDGLESSDPLRDTLNEIGTLSIVEQFKITRGDYG